jgi:hypothetical protein
MKFLSDEDFNNRILTGLFRRLPVFDLVRVQDVGLMGQPDPIVLDWAVTQRRLVLTHDFATMIDFAYERIEKGVFIPGVIAIPQKLPIGDAIEDLALLVECSLESEWDNQVVFIPLKT